MRWALLALALAQAAAAGEVSVRVLELFRPERVELAALQGGSRSRFVSTDWQSQCTSKVRFWSGSQARSNGSSRGA